MRYTDVAIAGAGLAGSAAAAMLAEAKTDVLLIDPREIYPPDFRCEKLDVTQIEILKKTGLADAVLNAATPDRSLAIARFGRLVDKRDGRQCGIYYADLVNTIRKQVPADVFVASKVDSVATSNDRQILTLSNGEQVSARLLMLATGLNLGLSHQLGLSRRVISENHSVSIGFDIQPVGRPNFDFSALTCYSENPTSRIAYVAFFPIGASTRANLFVYRELQDAWLKRFRAAPRETLLEALPSLSKLIGPFEVHGDVKIRPVDLYVTEGHRLNNIVIIGDAFATSCPAAGTGAGKALMDVQRLCSVYIPQWLVTPGMGVEKVTAFYDDPEKRGYDAWCTDKAYALKQLSLDTSLPWVAQRWARFFLHGTRGALRAAKRRLSGDSTGAVVSSRR